MATRACRSAVTAGRDRARTPSGVISSSPGGGRALISVRDSREDTKRDPRPSKPRVAGSNPAGRAISLKNSPIVPSAWALGAKVQANRVTGRPHRLAD